jgi:excisionase family DNA binding protein
MNRKMPDGYISVPEAAKLLHVSKGTMYEWMIGRRYIPYISIPSGARTFYYMRRADVEKFAEGSQVTNRLRQKNKEYEIIMITMGKIDVLFKTDSLYELSRMYTRMMERMHKLVRVRADGKILTIHESDKIGYAYHPRTKARHGL